MSKTDKLKAKLKNGTINAAELRTLLGHLGWSLRAQVGSHEQWASADLKRRMTIATHSKELKRYLIKEAQTKLLENK